MDQKHILLVVAVVIILYFAFTYFFSDPTVADLAGMHNGKIVKKIPAEKIPAPQGSNDFTFSIWFFVNNWNYRYGQEKFILKRSNNGGDHCPEIKLSGSTNNLEVALATYPDSGDATTATIHTCTVRDVPLQRWTHLLTTTSGRTLDVYLDGKLVKTCLLPGVPKMDAKAELQLCPSGGFSGYTSKLRYYARTLGPRESYEIYREGYSDSMFADALNRYKIRLGFYKDNQEVNGFEL
jgi:hypothetical protein